MSVVIYQHPSPYSTKNYWWGSGSLLNAEWILTTTKCGQNANEITIHIVVHDKGIVSSQIRKSSQIFVDPHPLYANSIALIRLSSPVNFNVAKNYASAICLPERTVGLHYPEVNSSSVVNGWGVLSNDGSVPSTLHQVVVKTLAYDDSSCLNSDFDDHWEQVEIVSHDTGDAKAEHPAIRESAHTEPTISSTSMKILNPTLLITTTVETFERTTTQSLVTLTTGDCGVTNLYKINLVIFNKDSIVKKQTMIN
ncbi:hypothetical protein I4U23_012310 [Adineta vaga]|nr:hypothetical protein I4U23_012310 [Adineta vaga]